MGEVRRAVDYEQRHHRDFVNHSLVVPKRSSGHTAVELDPAVRRRRWGPDEDRSAAGRGRRSVLAGPWASRHHELPSRGDVRRGGGLDHRAGRDPLRFRSDVVHRGSRITGERSAALRCSPTTTCGDRAGPAGSGGRPRRVRLVRDRRAGVAPGAVGVRLPCAGRPVWVEQTLADTQARYPGPRSDPLPLEDRAAETHAAVRALRRHPQPVATFNNPGPRTAPPARPDTGVPVGYRVRHPGASWGK